MPDPVTVTDKVYLAVDFLVNLAVTVLLPSITIVVVGLDPPVLQLANCQPDAGVAVSVTRVPAS